MPYSLYITLALSTLSLGLFSPLRAQGRLDTSLVAYYPFEGSALDNSDYGNHGTIFGNPVCTTGVNGNALFFDGEDDYIIVEDAPQYATIEREVTICGWARPSGLYNNTWMTILAKTLPGQDKTPFSVIYREQNVIPYLRYTGPNSPIWTRVDVFNAPGSLPLNQWSFFVWRFKEGQLDIFLNDELVTTYTFDFTELLKTDGPLEIARDSPGNTEFFQGTLDDVCIFNAALTDGEIRYLFASGKTEQPSNVTAIEQVICSGDSYMGYTEAGQYQKVLSNQYGCDSIIELTLRVEDFTTQTETVVRCAGEDYLGHTESGTYRDTLISDGCDTIRITELIVVPAVYSVVEASFCDPVYSRMYPGPGTYIDTLHTSIGCDSIRELRLAPPALQQRFDTVRICAGNSFEGYVQPGTYLDTLKSNTGCDTVRTLVLLQSPAVFTQIDTTICQGQQYAGYSLPGLYVDTLQAVDGCDSIRTLQLALWEMEQVAVSDTICGGDQVFGYTQPGQYVDTLVSDTSCPLVRTLDLSVVTTYIPNAFSPDGNGSNDLFRLYSTYGDLRVEELRIYDRWGGLVHESAQFSEQELTGWWNGTVGGKPSATGVYTYSLRYTCRNLPFESSGSLLLRR
ncbi:LamG-like jellyroll fold domain-containing protein [Lewinella sp. IMCC34183]|uniref:LamG-like jellyroll fold domain-containing protein n=1 Tax=Lewinella sp. IMCC34183 TaxID=2248762 RepID=UPI000E24806E|nr:LamG-like jellyroll fold domain-containing protein [Lewinella sp. IMCC34183]